MSIGASKGAARSNSTRPVASTVTGPLRPSDNDVGGKRSSYRMTEGFGWGFGLQPDGNFGFGFKSGFFG